MGYAIRRDWYPKVKDFLKQRNEFSIDQLAEDIVDEPPNPAIVNRLMRARRTRIAAARLRVVGDSESILVRSVGRGLYKILRTEDDFSREYERLKRQEEAAIARRQEFETFMQQNGYPMQQRLFTGRDLDGQMVPAHIHAGEAPDETEQLVEH